MHLRFYTCVSMYAVMLVTWPFEYYTLIPSFETINSDVIISFLTLFSAIVVFALFGFKKKNRSVLYQVPSYLSQDFFKS